MDTKITDIFYNLINSGISFIYNVNHKEGSIDYKVGEEIITLKAYQYIRGKEPLNEEDSFDTLFKFKGGHFFWYDLYNGEETNVIFGLIIREKKYYVPRLNRVANAAAIETIENVIKEYEKKLLTKISEDLLCAVSK